MLITENVLDKLNNQDYEDSLYNKYTPYYNKVMEYAETIYPLAMFGCSIGSHMKMFNYLLPDHRQFGYDNEPRKLKLAMTNLGGDDALRKNRNHLQKYDARTVKPTGRFYSVLHSFGMFNYMDIDQIHDFIKRQQEHSQAQVHFVKGLNYEEHIDKECYVSLPRDFQVWLGSLHCKVHAFENNKYYLITWKKH